MKKYRVITRNFGGGYSVMTDFMTRRQCINNIIGHWGHWPPFAYITTITDTDKLRKNFSN